MNIVLERWSRGGGGSLKIGAVGCRSFLRPSRGALVCGIGCTEPVNTCRQPVDTSGCLAASPRHPITSKHDSMKAKKSGISSFCSKLSYVLLGFPIEMSCVSLGYVRCRWNVQPTDRFFALKVSYYTGCNRVPRDAFCVSKSVYWLDTSDPAHKRLCYSVSGT